MPDLAPGRESDDVGSGRHRAGADVRAEARIAAHVEREHGPAIGRHREPRTREAPRAARAGYFPPFVTRVTPRTARVRVVGTARERRSRDEARSTLPGHRLRMLCHGRAGRGWGGVLLGRPRRSRPRDDRVAWPHTADGVLLPAGVREHGGPLLPRVGLELSPLPRLRHGPVLSGRDLRPALSLQTRGGPRSLSTARLSDSRHDPIAPRRQSRSDPKVPPIRAAGLVPGRPSDRSWLRL